MLLCVWSKKSCGFFQKLLYMIVVLFDEFCWGCVWWRIKIMAAIFHLKQLHIKSKI